MLQPVDAGLSVAGSYNTLRDPERNVVSHFMEKSLEIWSDQHLSKVTDWYRWAAQKNSWMDNLNTTCSVTQWNRYSARATWELLQVSKWWMACSQCLSPRINGKAWLTNFKKWGGHLFVHHCLLPHFQGWMVQVPNTHPETSEQTQHA